MAKEPRSLENLDEFMRVVSLALFEILHEVEVRPESVFKRPQFVLLLGVLTPSLGLMTKVSLAGIADDLITIRAADAATKPKASKTGVKKDLKKAADAKIVKKDSKKATGKFDSKKSIK